MDFIPGGKALKIFKGATARLGIKKVEKELLKQAQKAAKRAKKAAQAVKGGAKSVNQLNRLIQKGKASKSIVRLEESNLVHGKLHVHFKDGSALNVDGTWRHGKKVLTNEEIKFLKEDGWKLP